MFGQSHILGNCVRSFFFFLIDWLFCRLGHLSYCREIEWRWWTSKTPLDLSLSVFAQTAVFVKCWQQNKMFQFVCSAQTFLFCSTFHKAALPFVCIMIAECMRGSLICPIRLWHFLVSCTSNWRCRKIWHQTWGFVCYVFSGNKPWPTQNIENQISLLACCSSNQCSLPESKSGEAPGPAIT